MARLKSRRDIDRLYAGFGGFIMLRDGWEVKLVWTKSIQLFHVE
jgi:hypothetical protein